MNKEQIEGVAKDIAGKVQEGAGKIIGSKEQQAKGLEKQVEGKLEKKVGDAREVIEDTVKKITNP
ncbi:CsbD family protein [Undibacterium sp. TC9W]|uniref:CsbD family protein n=1 Tax=Undibacterium sp. TC9W TaxID=3413053 RepID=UPI003BF225D7